MQRVQPPALSRLLAGDRRSIARAVSAIENGEPAGEDIALALAPHVGRAHVLGITGPPGAGKSTLINALLGQLVARGKRIAVIAVDPSSPLTGGAVLGDRVRMGQHGTHEGVFIRSVASRGHLGGLSRTTGRMIDVFDAAGFDVVIVETVGAGQSEVEITALADTRLVVCPPGLGDEVQALKAGILEIADLLVVNKGDLPAADAAVRHLEDMLRLRPAQAREVPVLKASAVGGEGIVEVLDAALAHAARVGRGRRFAPRAALPDAIAAVDRALCITGAAARFGVDAIDEASVASILAAAAASVPAPADYVIAPLDAPARIRVIELLAAAGESNPMQGAPTMLVASIARAADASSWFSMGMHVQSVLAAARGRGLAAVVHPVRQCGHAIERACGLAWPRTAAALIALGHPLHAPSASP